MKKHYKGIYSLLMVTMFCLAWLVSCNPKAPAYQQTEDGLCYRFYDIHQDRNTPQLKDYLKLRMDYYLNDSLIYSSKEKSEFPRIQYQESQFSGDILSGLGMMHEGDSASFIVRADSTFYYLFSLDSVEGVVKSTDRMRFEIRLLEIQSEALFREELQAMMDRRDQEMEALKSRSEAEFNGYLVSHGINEKPSLSTVYVIPMKSGSGPKIQKGMDARIVYEVYALDGTHIGSSDSLGMVVPVGDGTVLKGLDEGLSHLYQGEKAKLLVPYPLAFGESGNDVVLPYANLVFEVEVLEVMKRDSK
ncbi:MAG: FKBP-type peptidyl-prolyl cis-trans isomerase [Bacteroidales bacterium]|nr:FKBP-type peptidyl-prolyl cis-trans isomerase [Bacteroidales bacterium]